MVRITTDRARAFTGKNVDMIKLLENKLKAEHPESDILSFALYFASGKPL